MTIIIHDDGFVHGLDRSIRDTERIKELFNNTVTNKTELIGVKK